MGKNRRRRQKPSRPEEFAPKDIILNKASSHNTKKRPKRGKMTLKTNSKDYAGSINLPERVSQRKYESEGEFMARINRMVAQAKEQASIEAKFDTKLK